MLSALVSALHLLALAIGLPSIVARGRILKRPLDREGFRRLFIADNLWGVAVVLWIVTGLLRAFAGLEKGMAFYLGSHLFWLKMVLFLLILALEIWPMATFIRWRVVAVRGGTTDTSRARTFYVLSHIQMVLAVLMVFVASFMARGFGAR